MKVAALVAARLGSERLPEKVLRPLAGVPILKRMMGNLSRCRKLDEVVIVTSDEPQDDAIYRFAIENNFLIGRGSESDVLGRYYKVAKERGVDVVVRLTGDCPLIDPEITDNVIERHLASEKNDFTSNVVERTYPRGFDTEIMSWSCLERLNSETTDMLYREHVTNYIYDNPGKFVIESVKDQKDYSGLRICVDTEEDFELVEKIVQIIEPEVPNFGYREIYALIDRKPELKEINAAIEQAKIFKNKINPKR